MKPRRGGFCSPGYCKCGSKPALCKESQALPTAGCGEYMQVPAYNAKEMYKTVRPAPEVCLRPKATPQRPKLETHSACYHVLELVIAKGRNGGCLMCGSDKTSRYFLRASNTCASSLPAEGHVVNLENSTPEPKPQKPTPQTKTLNLLPKLEP